MSARRLLELASAPLACLLVILVLCLFAVQRPVTTASMIPALQKRDVPPSNCALNGFTIYLRADGKLAVGSQDNMLARDVILSQAGDLQGRIQNDSFNVVVAPGVSYGQVFALTAELRQAAPRAHIALMSPAEQAKGPSDAGAGPDANRCQYVWPAAESQPGWQPPQAISSTWPHYHVAGAQ